MLYDFGFPMGPFAMSDLAGLDVGWRIRKGKRREVAGGRPHLRARALRPEDRRRLLQATRRATARRSPTPRSRRSSSRSRTSMGITRRARSPTRRSSQRLLYPMVNEGAKILEEKIAIRASDIDVIWVYGYGWPVYRGGPMFWADSIGLKAVRDRMLAYKKQRATTSGRPPRCWTASPRRARGSWDSFGLTGSGARLSGARETATGCCKAKRGEGHSPAASHVSPRLWGAQGSSALISLGS